MMILGLRTGAVALAVMSITGTAFAANGHRGSMEDQLACTPDVYRLCSAQVPDEDAIVACLKRNKASLSSGCAAVFARPDPGATSAPNSDDD